MEKDFCRATISERDFEEAEGYLVEYPDSSSAMAQKAFLVAAVIAYGRPFTKNERNSNSKASARVPLINDHLLTDQEKHMHESLLRLRNKAIAHSEFEYNPVSLGEVVINGISFKVDSFEILNAGIDIHAFLVLCRKRKKQAMDTGFEAAQESGKAQDAL